MMMVATSTSDLRLLKKASLLETTVQLNYTTTTLKLTTTSSGITVTGTVSASTFSGSLSGTATRATQSILLELLTIPATCRPSLLMRALEIAISH